MQQPSYHCFPTAFKQSSHRHISEQVTTDSKNLHFELTILHSYNLNHALLQQATGLMQFTLQNSALINCCSRVWFKLYECKICYLKVHSYNLHHMLWQQSISLKKVQYLQQMVQSGKWLDENVCTFVWKLVSSGSEEIEYFIKIEVIVSKNVKWKYA